MIMREPQGSDPFAMINVEPQKQQQRINRPKFGALLKQEPHDHTTPMFSQHNTDADGFHLRRKSNASQASGSGDSSPTYMSSPGPWNQSSSSSPFSISSSPWIAPSPMNVVVDDGLSSNGLIGTIVREEGHVYSLASAGDLLYTGSDSKNIRVWKNMREFSGFKANSGFVKAIIIAGDRIYTGHQDGKIRVWSVSSKNHAVHKRVGSLPSKKEFMRGSMNPKNYVEGRKNHNVLKIRHFDAVSCMSLNEELGLLYSGSWDKTMKVWRIANSKCLESIEAHDDAINSVVTGFDGLVFTGSADGTVKVWKRELHGKKTQHFMVQILLKQDNAVTGLAVNLEAAVLYCGSSDGNVNFWEREKQLNHGGVLRGHKLAVLCVAAAGNLVFSGSADKTVCVWRREGVGEHTRLNVLTGHMGPVKCLTVEPDRDVLSKKEDQRWILYSGSLDKTLKVWRVMGNAPAFNDYSSRQPPCNYDLI